MIAVQLPPTIAIYGYKDSGKTAVATHVIQYLTTQSFQVLSAKHVGEPDFTLDQPGTDSFRHIQAGAAAVLLHSASATALLFSQPANGLQNLLIRGLAASSANVIVLEGFRSWTQQNPDIAKIICARTVDEISELKSNTKGSIIATCSLQSDINGALYIPKNFNNLIAALNHWLNKEKQLTKK